MTVEQSQMTKNGLVQIYTGNGKGKTTAGVGLAVRSLSYGWRVLVVQFLKQDCKAFNHLDSTSENITVKQFGRPKITLVTNVDDEDKKVAQEGWQYVVDNSTKNYDMIILDEVLPALNLGLITKKDLYSLIDYTKQNKIELVLTGRMWSRKLKYRIYDKADLVTKCTPVKHYFNMTCKTCNREYEDVSYTHCPHCGNELIKVLARKGVEF